jgi:acetyl esterase/lipase
MGLTENRSDLQPGNDGVDTSVQACVPFYGVYDFLNRSGARPSSARFLEFLGERVLHATPEEDPARWELASPVTQVHADAPPFMVLHGARDSLAPVADARLFARHLREVSRKPGGVRGTAGCGACLRHHALAAHRARHRRRAAFPGVGTGGAGPLKPWVRIHADITPWVRLQPDTV